jgi:hypothetical protein
VACGILGWCFRFLNRNYLARYETPIVLFDLIAVLIIAILLCYIIVAIYYLIRAIVAPGNQGELQMHLHEIARKLTLSLERTHFLTEAKYEHLRRMK